MGLKKFKPITPGQRHKVLTDFVEITSSTPENLCCALEKPNLVAEIIVVE